MIRARRHILPQPLRLGLAATLALIGGTSLVLGGPPAPADQGDEPTRLAVVMEVRGPIGPGVTNYLRKSFQEAEDRGASILVIELDTPGGLVDATRDIIHLILRSEIPVVVYVSPSGARAASAGTFILYASHVAAMAPGTTMGAATPVQMGGGGGDQSPFPDPQEGEGPEQQPDDDPEDPTPRAIERKALEDAVAYIRALAELRGRNVEWAEKAVREAATVTNTEAVEQEIVDLEATSVADLLEKIDGWTVKVGHDEREVTLETSGAEIEHRLPDWVDELLGIITNPNVAFIFMMLGIYGLFFELANPGAIIPGTLGAISLLIALYALNVLPLNFAGLGLLLLGVALMVGEAFAPSFGILGMGGLVAFGLGAIMLFDVGDPAFQLSYWTVLSVMATTAVVLIFLLRYLIRAQSRAVASGDRDTLIGRVGTVADWSEGRGRIILDGEWWNAVGPEDLAEGQEVRVEEMSGLRLTVGPAAPETTPEPQEG